LNGIDCAFLPPVNLSNGIGLIKHLDFLGLIGVG
jgi:hypothetical protein